MTGKPLMQRLLDAGYPREEMTTHESDLYVFVTKTTEAIVEEWCRENGFRREYHCPIFRDAITGSLMYDLAFQNVEYWGEKCGEQPYNVLETLTNIDGETISIVFNGDRCVLQTESGRSIPADDYDSAVSRAVRMGYRF